MTKNYKFIYEDEYGEREEFIGTKKECQDKFFDYQKDIYNCGLSCSDLEIIKISTGDLIDLGYSCEDGDLFDILECGYDKPCNEIDVQYPIVKMYRKDREYFFELENGCVVKTGIHPNCK